MKPTAGGVTEAVGRRARLGRKLAHYEWLAGLDLALLALAAADAHLRNARLMQVAGRVRGIKQLVANVRREKRTAVAGRRGLDGAAGQKLAPRDEGREWRVWVRVKGRTEVGAVAHIGNIASPEEAVGIVLGDWDLGDWDSEAFAYMDRRGRWRYYRLRANDKLVLDRVEKATAFAPPDGW